MWGCRRRVDAASRGAMAPWSCAPEVIARALRELMWVRARWVCAAVALGINVTVGLGSSDVQQLVVAAGLRGIGGSCVLYCVGSLASQAKAKSRPPRGPFISRYLQGLYPNGSE